MQLWRFIEGAQVPEPNPGKTHLAESRSASADLQAAIEQSAKSASSAVDAARETRSKRVRFSDEARTPSTEGSSNPSSVGHQAKKPKREPAEANIPILSRGTPHKPAKEVPVQKQKISQPNAVAGSQEASEKPTPKAAVPKLKQLQTAISLTDDPDAMIAIHKDITILMVRISASSRSLVVQTIDTDYRKKRRVAKSSTRNESSPSRNKSSPSRNRSSSLRNK